jgi:hypothetical protein
MNALLAKLICAIWFIGTRLIDRQQIDAATLFPVLPSWLRDHPPLLRSNDNAAMHN